MLQRHAHWRLAAERYVPNQQLVQHDAERVQVRPTVEWQREDLLRCRVLRRAHERANHRQTGVALQQFGNAEVRQERAVSAEEDVVRFDVAMDDALLVRDVERGQDLFGQLQDPSRGPGRRTRGAQQVLERSVAGQEHDQVQQAVLFARVVHRQDVWVFELRDRLGFTLEAPDEVGSIGQRRLEDLDGHPSVQAGVLGFVHRGHATAAKDGEQTVAPQSKTTADQILHVTPFSRVAESAAAARWPIVRENPHV